MRDGGGWKDERLEETISKLLRGGVLVSATVVFAGGMLFLSRHGGEHLNRATFGGEPADLRSVGGVLGGAFSLHGRDIIQLGLLLLIATPIARVAFAAFGFLRQGDRLYVAITLLVLTLLTYSLAIGRV